MICASYENFIVFSFEMIIITSRLESIIKIKVDIRNPQGQQADLRYITHEPYTCYAGKVQTKNYTFRYTK